MPPRSAVAWAGRAWVVRVRGHFGLEAVGACVGRKVGRVTREVRHERDRTRQAWHLRRVYTQVVGSGSARPGIQPAFPL